jgi:hypothetical protein
LLGDGEALGGLTNADGPLTGTAGHAWLQDRVPEPRQRTSDFVRGHRRKPSALAGADLAQHQRGLLRPV